MPHKHTRRLQDESAFDLPPTQIARPLPVKEAVQKDKGQQQNGKGKGKAKAVAAQAQPEPAEGRKRKRATTTKDDAPRAFKRLMAFANGKKPRPGLDNGDEPKKKGKRRSDEQKSENTEAETQTAKPPKPASAVPTILPGERMSEFSARVDAALPLSGLVNKSMKGNKDPLSGKVWRTYKEKKMHKMYDEWREQERKRKENLEEELEMEAAKEIEDEENGVSWKLNPENQLSGKKKKRSKDDEDPWAVLRKQRGETRPGLHDVVQAPPEFTVKPSKQLLVRGAAVNVKDIPKNAGSLKRREELQAARDDIISAYRKKMEAKRSVQVDV
ncbi:hypothetical protein GGS20DRAFT_172779 [Poronia punctata]|nr:hypothetical protein GGS20DRAFT_172779 [Poronia punctata]